jgi:hypothetical protein
MNEEKHEATCRLRLVSGHGVDGGCEPGCGCYLGVGMECGQVTILDGSTFVVSDGRGDVDAGPAQVQGLFYRDMRHLSTWRLLLDGRPLEALASDLIEYDCATFFLVVPTGTVYASPTVSLIRRRTVGDGMREELTVRNSSGEAVSVQLMMVFGCDFADIFEVKDAETKKGRLHVDSGDGAAVLSYTRGDFGRQTTITAPGAVFSRGSLMYPLVLEPGQSWTGEITVTVGEIEATVAPKPRSFHSAPTPNMDSDLAEWVAAAPSIDCDELLTSEGEHLVVAIRQDDFSLVHVVREAQDRTTGALQQRMQQSRIELVDDGFVTDVRHSLRRDVLRYVI